MARWLARHLWWGMLWLMRRPWMKQLQRSSVGWLRPERRQRAWSSIKRQNAFALRYGLGILTFAINVLLYSVVFTLCFYLLLFLRERGVLTVPG